MQLIKYKHLHPLPECSRVSVTYLIRKQTFSNEKQQKYVNLVYVTKNLLFYRPFSFVPYLRRETINTKKWKLITWRQIFAVHDEIDIQAGMANNFGLMRLAETPVSLPFFNFDLEMWSYFLNINIHKNSDWIRARHDSGKTEYHFSKSL